MATLEAPEELSSHAHHPLDCICWHYGARVRSLCVGSCHAGDAGTDSDATWTPEPGPQTLEDFAEIAGADLSPLLLLDESTFA